MAYPYTCPAMTRTYTTLCTEAACVEYGEYGEEVSGYEICLPFQSMARNIGSTSRCPNMNSRSQ